MLPQKRINLKNPHPGACPECGFFLYFFTLLPGFEAGQETLGGFQINARNMAAATGRISSGKP